MHKLLKKITVFILWYCYLIIVGSLFFLSANDILDFLKNPGAETLSGLLDSAMGLGLVGFITVFVMSYTNTWDKKKEESTNDS